MSEQICILGAGAWGTAMATLLSHNGHTVKLWSYEADVARMINENHCNTRYLPDIMLGASISATTDMQEALTGATFVFEATPVQFVRSVLELCRPFYKPTQVWVSLSKGIEQRTLLFPADMMRDVFGKGVLLAVVGGPGFAKNLARGEATGLMVAASDTRQADHVARLLTCDYVKTMRGTDMVGIQLCGAIKNVLSLGMGMMEGAGYGDNARALFLTAGFQDMLVCAFGLKAEIDTVHGLAGFGDLVLSSMGESGRNLALGKRLGLESVSAQATADASAQGDLSEEVCTNALRARVEALAKSEDLMTEDVSTIVSTTADCVRHSCYAATAEGMNTCFSMEALADKIGLDLPILCGIQAVAEGRKTIRDVVREIVV